MLDRVTARTGLTGQQAYALCSLAADLRTTQVVNGNRGVHVMREKRYLQPRA
jgi:acetamidase/formamidase